MNISDADRSEMLPSGKTTTFNNRVDWARIYLDKAGLIETPSRGKYRITSIGLKALESNETIDLKYLERFKTFKEFQSVTSSTIEQKSNEIIVSPIETLDVAYKKVFDTLASQLMDEIMKLTPVEFEKLVVELLLKMGYGSDVDEAGKVTLQTNDGGIDGIIKEDQLGFSQIYIQAKDMGV